MLCKKYWYSVYMIILGAVPYAVMQAMDIESTIKDVIVSCWFILFIIIALVVRKQ